MFRKQGYRLDPEGPPVRLRNDSFPAVYIPAWLKGKILWKGTGQQTAVPPTDVGMLYIS
ncbi:hypothetical protein [Negadavirga shengliensis]|uniref:Uncharacterized protein n=1 Tax=Negadavirga shengliensis TaxID=1389218 RepID=A0ABV9SZW9_9BACT